MTGSGEDITYFINEADNTKYLARHDVFGNGSTVLANRIDSMNIHYFDQKVTYTAAAGWQLISPMCRRPKYPRKMQIHRDRHLGYPRRSRYSRLAGLSTTLLSLTLFRCRSAQHRTCGVTSSPSEERSSVNEITKANSVLRKPRRRKRRGADHRGSSFHAVVGCWWDARSDCDHDGHNRARLDG